MSARVSVDIGNQSTGIIPGVLAKDSVTVQGLPTSSITLTDMQYLLYQTYFSFVYMKSSWEAQQICFWQTFTAICCCLR